MTVLLRSTVVQGLSREVRRLGMSISDYNCWRILQRIESKGVSSEETARELALTAVTMIPRPDWVSELIGGQ